MVFSLLAISKCSCIFLILDIDSPPNRIYKILKRAKVKLLITESNLSFEFETIDYKILNIDTLQKENLSSENLKIKPQLDTLAYLIFTSGSSGEPKGVMVSHMALAYRLRWIRENFKIDSTDCFAQSIQPTFDPFFIELLAPLSAGCLVALSPKGKSSAKVLVEFAIKYQITFMAFVPSTLESFLIEAKKHKGLNLKRACTGGETLKPTLFKLFKDVVKDGELFNVYGPTEACIFSTAWRCYELLDGNDFPIGEPIDGTYIYILNSDMRRVPIGEIGEIFIGGFGLAIGYLDDIELTKKRFVKNPFIEGEKLYATGDYGYFGADNNIYFKGRIDRQKKIDGYRIELEEIETSIKRIDSVKKTAVKIIKSNGKADICGWIVLRDELLNISKETHLNLIFENLNRELPFYMIPKRIFIVDEIFNDRNGKIDYKALITPKDEVIESRDSLTELEERLISIYKDVLNLDSIDVNDNFFEMGGDSLSALSVMVEIDKINGKKNSLLLILENQTIKKLASTLSKSIDTENICISFNREKNRKTLLIVSSKEGDIIRFRGLTTILQSSYNLSILQPLESMNYSSIEELAYIYSKNIPRELLYNQEITVIGFSIGGVVALELSRELKRLNLNLNRLVLIDSLFPNLLFRNIFGVKAILPVFERFNLLKGSLVRQMELLSNYRVKTLDIKSTLIISSKLSIFYKFIFKNWGKYINIDNIEMLDGFHGTLFGKNSADKLAKIVEEN
jgi:amino acid adenylation domain-containing protein